MKHLLHERKSIIAVVVLFVLAILAISVGALGRINDYFVKQAEAGHLNLGLVGYWKFDEGTGQIVNDSSGNANNGTLGTTSSPGIDDPIWTSGKFGGALDFDGANDYVDVGTMDVPSGAMTIAAWFKADSVSGCGPRLISKATSDTSDSTHWWMLSFCSDKLRFRLKTDPSGFTTVLIAPSGDLSTGVWTHAAATYDGATMKIYKDGVLVGSAPKTGTVSIDSSVKVNIGRNPDSIYHFNGIIDDVRVYNRALSQEEILNLISPASGRFESATFNAGNQAAFNRFDASLNRPINTNIEFQIAVKPGIGGACTGVTFSASDFVGPSGTPSDKFQTTQTLGTQVFRYQIPYNINAGQCFRYRVYMETLDPLSTAIFYDVTVNYSP